MSDDVLTDVEWLQSRLRSLVYNRPGENNQDDPHCGEWKISVALNGHFTMGGWMPGVPGSLQEFIDRCRKYERTHLTVGFAEIARR